MAWWLAGSIIRDLAASLWAQLSRTTDPTVPRPCGTTARCLHLLKYSTHQVRSVAALTLAPPPRCSDGERLVGVPLGMRHREADDDPRSLGKRLGAGELTCASVAKASTPMAPPAIASPQCFFGSNAASIWSRVSSVSASITAVFKWNFSIVDTTASEQVQMSWPRSASCERLTGQGGCSVQSLRAQYKMSRIILIVDAGAPGLGPATWRPGASGWGQRRSDGRLPRG